MLSAMIGYLKNNLADLSYNNRCMIFLTDSSNVNTIAEKSNYK